MDDKCFLLTRSRHDETTNYLFYWAGKTIKEAEKRNFTILDLSEEKANPRDFDGRMSKLKPGFVFFNGHGDSDLIRGYDNQILVKVHQNENLLKNCIIYALSCRSADILGQSCINKGTKSYLGYNDDFIFLYEEEKITHPLEDKTAALFLEPSNLLVTSLLKGNSTAQSHRKSQEKFRRNIRKVLTSDSPQEDKSSAPWLIWDMVHQVCLGSQSAKL